MGAPLILLAIITVFATVISTVISFFAYFDGKEAGKRNNRYEGTKYTNSYIMPFALLFDRGYDVGGTDGTVVDKNRRRFKRE